MGRLYKSVFDNVREFQRMLPTDIPFLSKAPAHNPELLLIGCIDARLALAGEIGIPQGSALIKRKIAALISPFNADRIDEMATMEFAVDVKRVRDIVVMGHTDCGGIRACVHGGNEYEGITRYLRPLEGAREKVRSEGGDEDAQAASMEREAIRQSVANLMTYPAVKKAVEEGRLKLHGWLIDTGSKRISEMDPKTGEFKLMVDEKGGPKPRSTGSSFMSL